MSDFYAMNIALTSLYAQRLGMETTGNNIANANTEGYSRQRVRMASQGNPGATSMFSNVLRGGGGVDSQDILRIRDEFLLQRSYQEHGTQSSYTMADEVYGRVEQIISEPGDQGIQSLMNDFWAGWHDVMNTPDDLSARQQLIERSLTLTNAFNATTVKLDDLEIDLQSRMEAAVTEVNDKATQVGQLNESIRIATLSGTNANDLMDRRDGIVKELAEKLGVTTRTGEYNQVTVLLGGSTLVNGNAVMALAYDDTGPTTAIEWAVNGTAASISSGEMGAMLTAVNTTIPGLQTDLDTIAAQLASDVNTQHQLGYDLTSPAPAPPAPDPPPNGVEFFSAAVPPFTAANITVNSAIVANANLVAASSATGARLNGTNAKLVAALSTSSGGADEIYRTFVTDLGVQAQSAERRKSVQTAITGQVDSAMQTDGGVSLDEEMANMVSYQRAYEAASRFLKSIDEMLTDLLRLTG